MDVHELLTWVSDCRYGEGAMPKDDGFLEFFSTEDLAMADRVAREFDRARALDKEVCRLRLEVQSQAHTIVTLSERCLLQDARHKTLADAAVTLACSGHHDPRPAA